MTHGPRRGDRDPRRDRDRERGWLQAAERAAGQSGYTAHACRRLEMGQRAFHDHWAKVGPAWLLRELGEEAADIGAWSALTLQALDHGHGLGARAHQELIDRLAAANRAGAVAHAAIVRAAGHLAKSENVVSIHFGGPHRRLSPPTSTAVALMVTMISAGPRDHPRVHGPP